MSLQVFGGCLKIEPESRVGHAPVRRKCSSAHLRIVSSLSARGPAEAAYPRSAAKSRANVEPPGKPHFPLRGASST